ncbi:MAG TPA: hypothetical protein VH374_26310 [Polyangia bacterium]|jgi:hypothetical protein|nr:hypothetical protein [Polyangia bacterium]
MITLLITLALFCIAWYLLPQFRTPILIVAAVYYIVWLALGHPLWPPLIGS